MKEQMERIKGTFTSYLSPQQWVILLDMHKGIREVREREHWRRLWVIKVLFSSAVGPLLRDGCPCLWEVPLKSSIRASPWLTAPFVSAFNSLRWKRLSRRSAAHSSRGFGWSRLLFICLFCSFHELIEVQTFRRTFANKCKRGSGASTTPTCVGGRASDSKPASHTHIHETVHTELTHTHTHTKKRTKTKQLEQSIAFKTQTELHHWDPEAKEIAY